MCNFYSTSKYLMQRVSTDGPQLPSRKKYRWQKIFFLIVLKTLESISQTFLGLPNEASVVIDKEESFHVHLLRT